MKFQPFKILAGCCLLSLAMSCGNNNNQSEGAADSEDSANTTETAPVQRSTEDAATTTVDTVVKGPNSEPGQGNNTSGTGANASSLNNEGTN